MKARSLVILSTLCLTGCMTKWRTKTPVTPTQTVTADGTITQRGDAQVPGSVATSKISTHVALPPNSTVTFNETLGTYTLTLPAGSSFDTTGTRVETKGPTAFTPPAPPTPEQIAKGEDVARNWWFSALMAVVGGIMIYRAHVKAGLCFFAGAVGYPILQSFVSKVSANYLLVGACCVGGALYWAWHIMNDKQAAASAALNSQGTK